MNKIYKAPSFYAHVFNAILLLMALVLLYSNFSKIRILEPYKLIILTLLFSLTIGVHGLSHLGMESVYGYNPIYFR